MRTLLLYCVLIGCLPFLAVQSCGKRNVYIKRNDGDGKPANTIDSFQLIDPNYSMGSYKAESGNGLTTIVSARVANFDVPRLTQKILNSGSVTTYIRMSNGLYGSDAPYAGLPFRFEATAGGYYAKTASSYELGKLKIYYFFEQPAPGGVTPPGLSSVIIPTYLFKYVIVPGPDGY